MTQQALPGYEVCRYNASNYTYDVVKDVTVAACTVDGLTACTEYSYKIRAYRTVSGGIKVYGGDSDELKVSTLLSTPTALMAASTTANSISLTWSAVPTASGYEVYRFNPSNNKFDKLADTQTNSFNNDKLNSYTQYKYKVRAYKSSPDGSKAYSDYSAELEVRTILATPVGAGASNVTASTFDLSWNNVASAKGYEVSIYNTATGTYTPLAETSKNSYKVSGLHSYTQYRFIIRAFAGNGSARVYSEYCGEFKVTTNLATPIDLKVTEVDAGSSILYWSAVTAASGYEVKLDKKVDTIRETGCSCKLLNLDPYTRYSCSVRAFVNNADGTTTYSEYSPAISFTTKLYSVSGIKATATSDSSVNLSWMPVLSSTGYEIFRYNSTAKKYEKTADTTGTVYTDSGLKPYTAYKYKVRAYAINTDGSRVYGGYSSAVSVRTKLEAPKGVVVSAGESSVKFKWSASASASGYEIYRNGSTKAISVTKLTSFTDKNLKSYTVYKYKIRAYYIKSSGAKVYSDYTQVNVVTSLAAPSNLKAVSLNATSVKLSWSKVTNATGYRVYRYNSSKKKYERIATTGSTSYVNKGLKAYTKYNYKVIAYTDINVSSGTNAGRVYSAYSSVLTVRTRLATVTGLKVTNTSASSLKLTWSKVTNAKGYYIYRATKKSSGVYKKIATVKDGSTLSYTNSKLTAGDEYYYKVVAYGSAGSACNSASCAPVSKKVVPLKTTGLTAAKSGKGSATLIWKKQSGVSGYTVYRSTSKTGTYTKVKNVSNNAWTDSGLTAGKTYYYKVAAYKTVSGKKVYGSYSSVKGIGV